MQSCETPFGILELDRYPTTRNPTLQPWDTADLYLLQSFAETGADTQSPVLVINDNFGTLACALALGGHQVISWGDSWLAEQATRLNAEHNALVL